MKATGNRENTERNGTLLSDLRAFGMVATVSIGIGLLVNQFREQPLPLVYQSRQARLEEAVSRTVASSETPGQSASAIAWPQNLSLDEFRTFVMEKRGLVLDARPEIFHRLGHVPGAISLPREDFEKRYASLKLDAARDQRMVVYCSGDACEDSALVQKALMKLGYARVAVFREGWAAWTRAGLPEEKAL